MRIEAFAISAQLRQSGMSLALIARANASLAANIPGT
jgi:hypothetical protein